MKTLILKEKKMLITAIIIGLLVTFGYIAYAAKNEMKDMKGDLASRLIRFHCLANSDSNEDQALKIKVKNKVLEEVKNKLGDISDINVSREVIKENIEYIKEVAEKEIEKNGYNYKVQVKLEKEVMFPTKRYGDVILPSGKYEALRILIGEAKGRNWWCVMFPPLCFTDASCNVVDTKSKEKLEEVLTEEQYKLVVEENHEEVDVKVKFKLLEMLK